MRSLLAVIGLYATKVLAQTNEAGLFSEEEQQTVWKDEEIPLPILDPRPVKDWTGLNDKCTVVQTEKLALLGCPTKVEVIDKASPDVAVYTSDTFDPEIIGTFAYDDAERFLIQQKVGDQFIFSKLDPAIGNDLEPVFKMPSDIEVTFLQINMEPSPFVILVANTLLGFVDLSVETTETPELLSDDFTEFDPKSQN